MCIERKIAASKVQCEACWLFGGLTCLHRVIKDDNNTVELLLLWNRHFSLFNLRAWD